MATAQSSRLIVKNLPKTATKEKLRNIFGAKGTITDVQLKYTPDGKFRSFAFIGYKEVEEAEQAVSYFNNTFIGTTKITVEQCHELGDPNKAKAWSKYATEKVTSKKRKAGTDIDTPEPRKSKKKTKEAEILEKCKEDPDFLEFLETHRKKTTWGNDTVVDELEKLAKPSAPDATKQIEPTESKLDSQESDLEDNGKENKIISQKRSKSRESGVEADDSDTSADEEVPKKGKKKKLTPRQASKEHTREKKVPEKKFFTVKLRDLPKKAKKQDIRGFFAPLTPKSIRLPPKFRGIAYVGFATKEEQGKAMSKNKSFLLGNRILIKKYEHLDNDQTRDEKKSRWTAQEEELQKESEPIGESGRIFIRNLSYHTNEDEIREAFEKFGPVTEVHLPIDRLTRKIKGFGFVSFFLPEHATEAFSQLDGTIFQGRMLHLLPAKTKEEPDEDSGMSFKKAQEIKQKKNAGSSRNWNTLFLGQNAITEVVSEKYGVSREELLLKNNTEGNTKDSSVAVRLALAESEIVHETKTFLEANGVSLAAFEDKATERSKTCFLVKNLNARTSAKDLVDLFSKHGELGRVVLPPSGVTAIVEFIEPAEARAAFKKLAYSKFQGLPLYLEWSSLETFANSFSKPKTIVRADNTEESRGFKSNTPEEDSANDKKGGTKLLVKNVPFQATVEEVKNLFSTFGTLKACRLPMKFDGSGQHRGFAFVDFAVKHEAKRAFETLGKSTHLYGRRLVLEWAAKDETVEELRQKTAKQYEHQVAGHKLAAQTSTKKMITRYFQTQSTKRKEDEDDYDEG